jgi:hypothetical protein
MASVKAKSVSDTQFRTDVAKQIHTTDGVWAPDTSKMKKVDGAKLPAKLKPLFNKLKKETGEKPDVFTTQVDGKPVYLFQSFDSDVGAGTSDLRDQAGRQLKMGDQAHKKIPLPHSEEPAIPVSRETWLADLKDAMRYPVQAADTPVIKGSAIPAGVQTVVDKWLAMKGSDGMKTYDSVEVHHVRVDGHDSYLLYGNAEDGQSQEMYEANGQKLDVMI